MSYAMKKTDFIRDCFYAVLSDGKPHRYGEILEYALQRSKGTQFEGELDNHNIVHAFNLIIGPGCEYQRVRHGVYQKCAPEVEQHTVPIQSGAIQNDLSLYPILDSACALIDRMHNAFSLLCEAHPEARDLMRPSYDMAAKHLDQSIDGISAWIAQMEDMANGMDASEGEETEDAEDEAPVMRM